MPISSIWVNELAKNSLNTLLAITVLVLIYLIIAAVSKRHISEERVYNKFKGRLFYTLGGFFLFFLTKIWVEGFTHLFTMLGLVSAGLVIANKEFVMNLVGWLVINWRGLFTERDFVQIGQYSGYVYEMGMLYFRLLEGLPHDINRCTGRIIKIPNGLVIHHAIINLSTKTNLIAQSLHWTLTLESDYAAVRTHMRTTAESILADTYKDNPRYDEKWLAKRNKVVAQHVSLKPTIHTEITQHAASGVTLSLQFYCFPVDAPVIKDALQCAMIDRLKASDDAALTTEA